MTHNAQCALALVVLALAAAETSTAQLADTCAPNSAERRGGVGCTIVETKALPDGLREPLFWHIDRFESLERARSAVGPASVAFDAASASWLMTIESQTSDHHGGEHVTQVGPLQLPNATKYAMQAFSSLGRQDCILWFITIPEWKPSTSSMVSSASKRRQGPPGWVLVIRLPFLLAL